MKYSHGTKVKRNKKEKVKSRNIASKILLQIEKQKYLQNKNKV